MHHDDVVVERRGALILFDRKTSWVTLLHDRKRFISSPPNYFFCYACGYKKAQLTDMAREWNKGKS